MPRTNSWRAPPPCLRGFGKRPAELPVVCFRCGYTKATNLKLLGFLLKQGLDSLNYEHQPNAHSWKACPYCSRGSYISIDFKSVTLEEEAAGEARAQDDSSSEEDGGSSDEGGKTEKQSYGSIHREAYLESYRYIVKDFRDSSDDMYCDDDDSDVEERVDIIDFY